MKTLYISDLDGTLLNNNAELSDTTVEIVNRLIADGLHFSVATARTAASADHILAGLALNLPVVLMNGVLIRDPAEKRYLQVNTLPPETVRTVAATLKAMGAAALMYEIRDGEQKTYYESLDRQALRNFVEARKAKYHKTFTQTDFSSHSGDSVIYFTLLDRYDVLEPVYDAVKTLPGINALFYKDSYSADLWLMEIHSASASKKNGVRLLRETYGFDRVIGFGDNTNDLPMFEACDIKVAVANARPEVLAAVGRQCGANGADGVARWIEEDFYAPAP
ncbi:MAG: Cof-type HAD-IIB family hydrolase [Oscillospiraceae bacterium]|jgi:Cof subfamily protein (haloacid dehalogenase superfamily)|nr:Cof-type HAD-IIB family hydrolase [Oscillospiraceae bacterium]